MSLNNKATYYLPTLTIVLISVLIVNFCGIFLPILRNDDSVLYAVIAKNIILNHDWVNLTFRHDNWLDKPHFQFWLTAFSFKFLGINSFSYILPAFCFYLLGGVYTFKLSKMLYNKEVALIALIVFFTSFHLLISSTIDVRAEAYLIGEIMPASYYWYKYNDSHKVNFRYLILGALFTALAIMTKGVFTIITVGSGVLAVWVYKAQVLKEIISIKWLSAIVLTLIFITPELLSLHLQFGLHPEHLVFGKQNFSAFRWFFWDSQFGRFLNNGEITVNHPTSWHYVFFIHTLLWSFLPWSLIFIFCVPSIFTNLFIKNWELTSLRQDKLKQSYMFYSFFITFIIFSLSSFQLDHYINIVLPFLAILTAKFIHELLVQNSDIMYSKNRVLSFNLSKIQLYLSYFIVLISCSMLFLIFKLSYISLIYIGFTILAITSLYYVKQKFNINQKLLYLIIYPVLSILLLYIFVLMVYKFIYEPYDVGYKISSQVNSSNCKVILDYKVNSLTLEFYSKTEYYKLNNLGDLLAYNKPYCLAIDTNGLQDIKNVYPEFFNNGNKVGNYLGATIDVVIKNSANKDQLRKSLNNYELWKF